MAAQYMQGFHLAQCVYEYEAQRAVIRETLNRVMRSVLWTQALKELEPDHLCQRAAELWLERFVPLAPIIKHGGFHEEREWRLISPTISCTDRQWKVRSGRSMLIPYIPIKLAMIGSHIPIREIIVGPTPHMNLALVAAGDWLTYKGIWEWDLHNMDWSVGNSKVPYRNW